MGPRSFNRGNSHGRLNRVGDRGCFNGAAVFQPRKLGKAKNTTDEGNQGFNGAAVFQPRKSGCQRIFLMAQKCFNGAAVFQPRKSGAAYFTWGEHIGFNGAAVFQPRK